MERAQFQGLPAVPLQRLCGCGQRVAWSHRQYLGRGRSAAVYICTGCGLAYRGREGQPEVAPARRRQRPLPDQGPPDNPVLDAELARRLQEMISKG